MATGYVFENRGGQSFGEGQDLLVNSTEQRLARVLLQLDQVSMKDGRIPKISQGDFGKYGWHHTRSNQFFYESVQEVGIRSLQRRNKSTTLLARQVLECLRDSPVGLSSIERPCSL
jgi:hypothetical protein